MKTFDKSRVFFWGGNLKIRKEKFTPKLVKKGIHFWYKSIATKIALEYVKAVPW